MKERSDVGAGKLGAGKRTRKGKRETVKEINLDE
jgi:hypothetical protein